MQNTNVIKTVKVVDMYIPYLYDQKSEKLYILSSNIASWAQQYPSEIRKSEIVKAYLPPVDEPIFVDAYSLTNLVIDIVDLKASNTDSYPIAILYEHLMSIMHAVSDDWHQRDKGSDFISDYQLEILKRIIMMKQNEILSTGDLTPRQALCRTDTLIREKFSISMREELSNTEFLPALDFITNLNTGSLVGANYEDRA